MKRIALVLGFIASLAFGQVANATPVTSTYADTALNWSGWTATTYNSSDPLGTPNIVSTSVTFDSATSKLLNITFNLSSHNYSVTSGDLFIDTNNDKVWEYVVRGLGTTLNGSATLNLYAISTAVNDTNAYTLSSGSGVRAGLPIGLASAPTSASLGSISYTAGANAIAFDFSSILNAIASTEFTIGYAVSCANDVVYQQVPVPEPGTMVLLGAGLLGLAIFGKRRMGKSA